ncbi:hypothetical protein BDV18DRAFT_160545 [Aspergillus unguis]
MHAKYLPVALAVMAMAEASTFKAAGGLSKRTAVSDDVPTLDEWIDDRPTESPDVTSGFGIDSDSSSSSSSSFGSSYDDDDDDYFSSSSSSGASSGYDDDTLDGTLGSIPSDIASQLSSALPPSVISEIANPTSLSSIYSEVQEGHYPSWATDLPSDVREYLEDEFDVDLSAVPTDGPTNGDPDVGSDEDGDDDGDDRQGSRDDDEDAAGMLAPSVLASVVGAVSVLGLALAL